MAKNLEPLHVKLHQLITSSQRILLATHEHADGDAFGSMLTFRSLLLREGRDVVALAPDSSHSQFSYLEGVQAVRDDAEDIRVDTFNAVVLFDCGDVRRTHLAEKLLFLGNYRPTVAVFDHHPTTTSFRGRELVDIPVIDTGVSSTCELVYQYVVKNRLTITPAIATALLTGIVTDTGGFTNLATTLESLEIASDLLQRGANLRRIVNATVRSKSVGTLQLWGRALSRLEHDPVTDEVSTALMRSDFEECRVDRESTEGIANFLNSLGEGKLVLVLREEAHGMVKGSLRTKKPDVDVATLARRYGGGGHKKAAGFRIPGKIAKREHRWVVETDSVRAPT